MAALAYGFGRLPRARHQADYDHLAIIDRPAAAYRVTSAETLVEIVDEVYAEPAWQAFTTLMLLRTNLAHRG